jgi:hypothetical protein
VSQLFETGLAALVFAAIFVRGDHVHPVRRLIRDRHTILSFGGGMAAAYVFVRVMPELSEVRSAFAESVSVPLRFEGMAIYFLALVGFLVFYGLDHMRARLRAAGGEGLSTASFRIHIGGFAAYVWVMSYILVHNLVDGRASTALYATAMGFHFLALENALREEHGADYERVGRFLLAGMCLAGWTTGQLVELPRAALAVLVAVTSGAVIMNSLIMELPTDRNGRFVPFMLGGILYGLLLVPMG